MLVAVRDAAAAAAASETSTVADVWSEIGSHRKLDEALSPRHEDVRRRQR